MRALALARVAGHQQDLHFRIILAGLECERDAVEPGHDNIREQELVSLGLECRQRSKPIADSHGLMTAMPERALDEGAHRGLVIRDQYLAHRDCSVRVTSPAPCYPPSPAKVTDMPVAASLGRPTLVVKGTLAPGSRRSVLTSKLQDCTTRLPTSVSSTLSFGTGCASGEMFATSPSMTSRGWPFSSSRRA